MENPEQSETNPATSRKQVNLLVADDHQLFLDGLQAILKSEPYLVMVAQALNGSEVLEALDKNNIDMVLLDINMPDTRAELLIPEIYKKRPKVKIIILTMDLNMMHYLKLMKCGIDGYMCKTEDKEELIKGINIVAEGSQYTSKKVMNNLSMVRQVLPSSSTDIKGVLTRGELRVLQQSILGLSNSEIADKLFLSKGTVDTHLKNIKAKLGSRNKTELILTCLQYGVLNF